jgi:hypothetical protein
MICTSVTYVWFSTDHANLHYVCLVDVKILLLRMLSGMSYVLALDNFVFDVQLWAGIK